jgi:hypothetical protein
MRKRITAMVMLLILCISMAVPALAAPPYRSYTYDAYGMAVPSPSPYTYDTEINGSKYGIGDFKDPQDMFIDKEYYIYVLDTGNNRVVIFDENKNLVRVISDMTYKGKTVTLNDAHGIFVYEYYDKKYLYIADTGNGQILRLDLLNELTGKNVDAPITIDKLFPDPKISEIDAKARYQPAKLIVDRAERMFVLCISINRGVVKLTKDGEYESFFGAPDVTYTPIEAFWRMISTKKQLEQMIKYVPTEYSNIAVDSRGFIYTTVSAMDRDDIIGSFYTDFDDVDGRKQYAPVRKLAADGTDILSRTGIFPPVGDIAVYNMGSINTGNYNAQVETIAGVSSFTDVCITSYDIYSVLDNRRMKVFTYDYDGNLLFEFGAASGNQKGTFYTPTAIANFKDDQICVLDAYSYTSCITFYKPTDYGKTILQAVKEYHDGNYVESEEAWTKVLKMNSNMTQAYTGVGKSLLRAGKYKEAMANFKIAINTEYYSKALEKYLNETIGNKFTYIFLIIVGLFILYEIYKLVKRFRRFLREGVKKVV